MEKREIEWLGVTSLPSAVGFLIAASLFAVLLVFLVVRPPWTFLVHLKALPTAPDTVLAAKRLADVVRSGDQIVILLGGSSARELTGVDENVSIALSQKCGGKFEFINAATSSQGHADAWSLAEAAATNGNLRLILVGMNVYRLREDAAEVVATAESRRVPLPWSHRLTGTLLASTGRYVRPGSPVSGLGALLTARAHLSFAPEREDSRPADPWNSGRNIYKAPVLSGKAKQQIANQYLGARTRGIGFTGDRGMEMWLQFGRKFTSSGAQVAFLALPEDKAMETVSAILGGYFDRSLKRLGDQGHRIVDLRRVSGLVPEDFYDTEHLIDLGRQRIFGEFVDSVAQAIPECKSYQAAT